MSSAETFEGKPCPFGHRLRYRISGKCLACTRARAKTMREAQAPPKGHTVNAGLDKSLRAWKRIASVRGAKSHIAALVGLRGATVCKWVVVPLEYVFAVSKHLTIPPEDLRPEFFCNDPLRRSAFLKAPPKR